MLPASYRLKKNADFKNVYQAGKSIANQYLVLYILYRFKERPTTKKQAGRRKVKAESIKGVRVGFSVSKKVGCAVTRNKIKRRMREAIRPYLHLIKGDVDLIFIARRRIKDASYAVLEKNLVHLLMRSEKGRSGM